MRLALNFQRIDPTKGGAETYVVDLCQRLVKAGHQVDLYAESWREGVLPSEIRCIAVPVNGRTRLARMKSFAVNSEAALQKHSYDCTLGFINTWHHDVIIPQGGVQRASLESNSKRYAPGLHRRLYRLGKMINPKFWAYEAIEKKQYDEQRQARVVAVSHMVKEHLQHFRHVPRTRIHVIPNAIDLDRIKVINPEVVRYTFRTEHGLAQDALIGLFVGHNFALKGLKPLLLALAERKKTHPEGRPIELMVCGGGKIAPFKRLADSLGLSDSIHWIGFIPDIRASYWSSDFFVQPTYYDPCSLVVFEALACGLPVITTACNGAGEVMMQGREGYILSAPDATVELVDALNQLTDSERRNIMSEHARELGMAQSFDNHVSRLIKVFEEVAASKPRRGPHMFRSSHEQISK
ncbi:glycosyltransferase family 4 protein [Singulisphaera sp. PoT]|uniref:glycosyltransferase family 4 protein n=1 Tax=Singulisphaera sp. PoT TaxID=3411797 RepID=UPI003BF58F9B